MAVDRRRRRVDWTVTDDAGEILSIDHAILAVLMDLRDELQELNALLHCGNFQGFPAALQQIAINTQKRKSVRKRKP